MIADAGRHIGGVVATLCDLFNPELIVVGGELLLGALALVLAYSPSR